MQLETRRFQPPGFLGFWIDVRSGFWVNGRSGYNTENLTTKMTVMRELIQQELEKL
jgi:hypothetical protein